MADIHIMKTLLILLAAVVSPLHAGELIPSQVPASAKWWAHADLDAMRGSETGKTVFARIEADHGAKLKAFKRMFSLHPINDLRGVTLYGDGKPDQAVALIDGTFDRSHMEDVVQGADDYTSSTYAGFTIHTWKDKGTLQHATFFNDKLLVFSRQENHLREALDVLKANPAATADPFFTADGGKPLVSACARLSEIDQPGDAARLIRMVNTMKVAANEHDGRFSLRMSAETAKPKNAERLRRMLDGVIAFAQAGDHKLDGLDLRADITTTPGQSDIAANLSLPVAEWISLMEKAAAEKAAKTKH